MRCVSRRACAPRPRHSPPRRARGGLRWSRRPSHLDTASGSSTKSHGAAASSRDSPTPTYLHRNSDACRRPRCRRPHNTRCPAVSRRDGHSRPPPAGSPPGNGCAVRRPCLRRQLPPAHWRAGLQTNALPWDLLFWLVSLSLHSRRLCAKGFSYVVSRKGREQENEVRTLCNCISPFRIAVEFLVRQPNATDHDLIGGQDCGRRLEPLFAGKRHDIVLIDTVAAHPEPTDLGTLVQRYRTGEEDNPVLVQQIDRIVEVRARMERIVSEDALESRRRQRSAGVQPRRRIDTAVVEDRERARRRSIDSLGKTRLGQIAERSVGKGRTGRNAC